MIEAATTSSSRENAVAIGLYRSGVEALVQANPIPGCMGYWHSRNDREIDFVLPPETSGRRNKALAVESKGDNQTQISNARKAIRQVFGRGVIATISEFAWDADIPAIPSSVFLAAIEERPRRTELSGIQARCLLSGSPFSVCTRNSSITGLITGDYSVSIVTQGENWKPFRSIFHFDNIIVKAEPTS